MQQYYSSKFVTNIEMNECWVRVRVGGGINFILK